MAALLQSMLYSDAKYSRENYPPASAATNNRIGTKSYEGKMTGMGSSGRDREVRVIDNTVEYDDVSDDLRKTGLRYWGSAMAKDFFIGIVCGAGWFGAEKAHKDKQLSGFKVGVIQSSSIAGGVLVLFDLITSSFAYSQWDDKFGEVCQQRRDCANDIFFVTKNQLTGKVVSSMETMHILLSNNEKFKQEFQDALTKGGDSLNHFFTRFITPSNPLFPTNVTYALGDREKYCDENGCYTRQTLMRLSGSVNQFIEDHHKAVGIHEKKVVDLLAEAAQKIHEAQEPQRVADKIACVARQACEEIAKETKRHALAHRRAERDRKIRIARENEPLNMENERRIRADYKAHEEVREVKRTYRHSIRQCAAANVISVATKVISDPEVKKLEREYENRLETEIREWKQGMRDHFTPRARGILDGVKADPKA